MFFLCDFEVLPIYIYITSKSHKKNMMSSKLVKTKKQKSRKIPKNQEKGKLYTKTKTKAKSRRPAENRCYEKRNYD